MTGHFKLEIRITNDMAALAAATAIDCHRLLLLVQEGEEPVKTFEDVQAAARYIQSRVIHPATRQLIFLAAGDRLPAAPLLEAIRHTLTDPVPVGATLLVPWLAPPVAIYEKSELTKYGQRPDGHARSFMLAPQYWKEELAIACGWQPERLAFELLHAYLQDTGSTNLRVLQVGKPVTNEPGLPVADLLERSMLIIPQAGPLPLLYRCLRHLEGERELPALLNICFDDHSYENMETGNLHHLPERLRLYRNQPLKVGPYPARHYSITRSEQEYMFFQDADDISAPGRFAAQLRELEQRGLDMIGSHELRFDEFERVIQLYRYPLDVSDSLSACCLHALFHPTSVVRRSAYLRSGGFSTNMRFGYDAQYLLRAHFFMKIGNIDDFYYLRFKRADSLTTSPDTHMDSYLRQFLLNRWHTDFRLIIENKLDYSDASIGLQQHAFDYRMEQLMLPAAAPL